MEGKWNDGGGHRLKIKPIIHKLIRNNEEQKGIETIGRRGEWGLEKLYDKIGSGLSAAVEKIEKNCVNT